MRLKVWINKKLVDVNKAKVSVLDRGFLYGDGLFETLRSYAGTVFKIDGHLDRLFAASKIIKIKIPYGKNYLKYAIYRTLEANKLKSAYVRLTVTRGEGGFAVNSDHLAGPNVVVYTSEFNGYEDWMYKRGIRVKIATTRQNEYSPLSRIKSLNFLNYILARSDAQKEGYDDAILMNAGDYITEGATSNIFLVKKDVVTTPSLSSGIIPGIAREVILQIAKRFRLKTREILVRRRDLLGAEEVFLTNSMAEVLPVIKIGFDKVGDGKPGPVTKLLHISYQKEVIKEVLR